MPTVIHTHKCKHGPCVCYLLKKSVMGRPTSTLSLAFFLPGAAFCAAGVCSPSGPSLPAAALPRFAASLQIAELNHDGFICLLLSSDLLRRGRALLMLEVLWHASLLVVHKAWPCMIQKYIFIRALLYASFVFAHPFLSSCLGLRPNQVCNSSPEGRFALLEHIFSQNILQTHLNKPPISPHCTH